MLLPVYAYGQPVLKRVAQPIQSDYPDLPALIENMFETMHHAEGVGIAAPQIGLGIRLFLIDTNEVERKDPKPMDEPMKMVFINAKIIEFSGETCTIEEGCLSIPDIRGDVDRPSLVRIAWLDENFQPHEQTFGGINARVIQHEYDHLEGVLFTERLKPLKKQLIRRKMENIRLGRVKADYKMRFFIPR